MVGKTDNPNFVHGPLGVILFDGNEYSALKLIESRIQSSKKPMHVHLVNAYTIALAAKDHALLQLLKSDSAINLIDSFWLSKLISISAKKTVPQCPGPSLFKVSLENGPDTLRHFLLGGSPAVLNGIRSKLDKLTRRERILYGSFAPEYQPLSEMDIDSFVDIVTASGANIVWVGLGTPKQYFVAFAIATKSHLSALSVGAAFDFYSGAQKEAPTFLRKVGLEWLFRLISEPRRLWKRYLIGNLVFMREAMKFLKGSK